MLSLNGVGSRVHERQDAKLSKGRLRGKRIKVEPLSAMREEVQKTFMDLNRDCMRELLLKMPLYTWSLNRALVKETRSQAFVHAFAKKVAFDVSRDSRFSEEEFRDFRSETRFYLIWEHAKYIHQEYKKNFLDASPSPTIDAIFQEKIALFFESRGWFFRENKKLLLSAIRQCEWALAYASDELRDDKEVVLIAVRKNGLLLQEASERLKSDPQVVSVATEENEEAAQYAVL